MSETRGLDGSTTLKDALGEPKVSVVHVALLSVSTPDERFLLVRLPDDHKWAPGKLDLLTVEHEDYIETQTAIKDLLQKMDIKLRDREIVAQIEVIGGDRNVAKYGEEYRDTRRVFLASVLSDEYIQKIEAYQQGIEKYSCSELVRLIQEQPTQFRRPVIIDALLHDVKRLHPDVETFEGLVLPIGVMDSTSQPMSLFESQYMQRVPWSYRDQVWRSEDVRFWVQGTNGEWFYGREYWTSNIPWT